MLFFIQMELEHINSEKDLAGLLAHSSCIGGGGLGSPQLKSPMKAVVKVNLPNHQKTAVQVKPGVTLKEALSKAMKLRELIPENCVVHRISPR